MATYKIQINERTSVGKYILAMLSAAPETVIFEKEKVKKEKQAKAKAEEERIYQSIASGFRDVRDILDGKQKGQTIDELIHELQCNID
jgi:hypothetical protein